MTILVTSCAVLTSLTWAALANVGSVVRAPGKLVSPQGLQVVQAPDAGVVARIFVKEGDQVEEGQEVALLDSGRLDQAIEDGQAKVAALQAALVRTEAETRGTALQFPASLSKYAVATSQQRSLYESRRAALQTDLASFADTEKYLQEELGIVEPLYQSGDIARSEVSKLRRQLAEARSQAAARQAKYVQESATEAIKIRDDLATQQQSLDERTSLVERYVIRAPASGVVRLLKAVTKNAVVKAGDELISLAPTGESLEVEVHVKPEDIASVAVGQTARLRFEAFDSAIFGTRDGVVTYVSPDTLPEDSVAGRQEPPQYRVRLRLTDRTFRHQQAPPELVMGMTVQAEIAGQDRTVLHYLLKPLNRGMTAAFTER